MGYYYEAHVTIEPVFDHRLLQFSTVCETFGFRVADLLMKKRSTDTEQRSSKDSFCTARSQVLEDIKWRTECLVKELKTYGFQVWRYKIEDTLLDSRYEDVYGLIEHGRVKEQEGS